MSSISTQLNQLKSYSAQLAAKVDTVTGAASEELTQADFLKLLTEQLQYQDPMEPMDNSQFVSQINQFSQLNSLNDINSNIMQNNSISQTLSLVGKNVTLIDPDDSSKTITGTVSEAKFNSTGSTIIVNGKEYPISLVSKVGIASDTSNDTGTGGNTNTDTANNSETEKTPET